MTFVWIGGYAPPIDVKKQDQSRRAQPVERIIPTPIINTHKGMVGSGEQTVKKYVGEEPQQRKPAILANQIMTSTVQTIEQNASIDEAWRLIKHHHIHHLPVVDGADKLVGILSDRDILGAIQSSKDKPAGDIMTRNLLAGKRTTSIRELAQVMSHHGIHCVPIINEDNGVVGILTSVDILKCVVNQAPLDLWI